MDTSIPQDIKETEITNGIKFQDYLDNQDLVDQLDENDREVFTTIMKTIETTRKFIGCALSEASKVRDKDSQNSLQTILNTITSLKSRIKTKFVKLIKADEEIQEAKKIELEFAKVYQALIDLNVIPETSLIKFKEYWNDLPNSRIKNAYTIRLKTAAKIHTRTITDPHGVTHKDLAGVVAHFEGAYFELSRRQLIKEQGLETLDETGEHKIKPAFLGYEDVSLEKDLRPHKPNVVKEALDFDVPIIRGNKPYLYETKCYPRKKYGDLDSEHTDSTSVINQLLKYQEAIKSGKIAGATIEIKGRIAKSLLDWAMKDLEDDGPIPDIEIIYTLPLPSGAEYRFPLKRVSGNRGLKFENTFNYTNEDLEIIEAVSRSARAYNIIDLLEDSDLDYSRSGTQEERYTSPEKIFDPNDLKEFSAQRNKVLWEKALRSYRSRKEQSTKIDNPKITLAHVKKILESMQENIRTIPQTQILLSEYRLAPDQYDSVAEIVYRKIVSLREERENPSTMDVVMNALERRENGYTGPQHGWSIDLETMIMAVVLEKNQASVIYIPQEISDCVKEIEDAREIIPTVITVHDPITRKQEEKYIVQKSQSATEEASRHIHKDINHRNIQRAREKLSQLKERFETIKRKRNESPLETTEAEFGHIQSELSEYFNLQNLIGRLEAQIAAPETPIDQKRKAEKELLVTYKKVFAKTWEQFALRQINTRTVNTIKMRYIVTAEGKIIVSGEEVKHGELAQNKNVYGAGEIIMVRDSTGEVRVTKINNRCLEYDSDVDSLRYVAHLLKERLEAKRTKDIQICSDVIEELDIEFFGFPITPQKQSSPQQIPHSDNGQKAYNVVY